MRRTALTAVLVAVLAAACGSEPVADEAPASAAPSATESSATSAVVETSCADAASDSAGSDLLDLGELQPLDGYTLVTSQVISSTEVDGEVERVGVWLCGDRLSDEGAAIDVAVDVARQVDEIDADGIVQELSVRLFEPADGEDFPTEYGRLFTDSFQSVLWQGDGGAVRGTWVVALDLDQ